MNNKKICILTLQGNYNFGNRLQNIALQYYLEKNNIKVVTFYKDYKSFKMFLKSFYAKIFDKFNILKRHNSTLILRETRFNKYCKKHLSYKSLKSFKQYICFVGSDQVWAPDTIIENDVFFLENIDCKKKFAYAASIAAKKVPDQLIEKYKRNIEKFDGVSVREENGKELLTQLNISNIECVLDPTLLLSREEWENFEEKLQLSKKPYAIKYFLSKPNEECSENIEKYCEKKSWQLIDLTDAKCKEWYKINPGEFLYLIKNSECFFTDSFHGTIFSWIYQIPFFVYSRISEIDMSSRIFDLLNLFNLENRLNMDINDENLQVNWVSSDIFADRLATSKIFIEKSLM